MAPIKIDGTDITGATIDGTDVTEITVDGDTVFSAETLPVAYSNLVAWYPMRGDASDATAGDANSGDSTDYSGTVENGTFSTNGVNDPFIGNDPSQAYNPPSGNEAITLPSGTESITSNNDPITIMAWVHPTSDPFSRMQVIDFFEHPDFLGINWRKFGDDKWRFFYGGNNIAGSSTFGSQPNLNEWYHLAISADGTNAEAYENGVSQGTLTNGGRGANNVAHNAIGEQSEFNGRNIQGRIDDVRIYDKQLSQSEINQIITNTQP